MENYRWFEDRKPKLENQVRIPITTGSIYRRAYRLINFVQQKIVFIYIYIALRIGKKKLSQWMERSQGITAWELVMERRSCSFSCSAARLCSLETMSYFFLALSFLSPLSFSSNQLCKALRLFKREGDELSNRYDLLLAYHMTASVSSQQNTIQTLPQLTKLPFGNSESIFILNKCLKKSKRK